jgi:serine/threonine protein kinase
MESADRPYSVLPRPLHPNVSPAGGARPAVQHVVGPPLSAALAWQVQGQTTAMVYTPLTKTPTPPKAFIRVGNLRLNRIDADKIVPGKQLGGGKFGLVYAATWKGANVAVKEIRKDSQQSTQEFEREAEQLAQLSHPLIVTFYGISVSDKGMRMVMEYCSGGTLRGLLDKGPIEWTQKVAFARELALALNYLHDHGFLHADLAADNVLIGRKGEIKLADFGLAIKWVKGKFDTTDHPGQVRPAWAAPEILRQGGAAFGRPTDMYSFGIVLWEIATARVPTGEDKAQRLQALPQETPSSYCKVMQQTWADSPHDRPTAAQAFEQLGAAQLPRQTTSHGSREPAALVHEQSFALARAWQQRFGEELFYISPMASREIGSAERLPAENAASAFLAGSGKVLLILGDSGMGKSSLLARLVQSGEDRIPILASLASLRHPEQDLMERVLGQMGLNPAEVQALKESPITLYLDGYDECLTEENLYRRNNLEGWTNLKLIITCRTERVSRMQGDYRTRFYPSDSSELQQLVLAPFDSAQIQDYLSLAISSALESH